MAPMNPIIRNPDTPAEPVLPEDEYAAITFLLKTGILVVPSSCPACGSTGFRQIRRNQWRCRDCRHEWGLRKGSILEGTRISFKTFIHLVRLFADDIPTSEAALDLHLAYNTVDHLFCRIRKAAIDAEPIHPRTPPAGTGEGDNDGVPGRTSADGGYGAHPVVFGIRLNNGRVTVSRVDAPGPEIITSLPIPTIKRGNILFIDAYGRQYQGFISYVPDRNGQEIIRIRARQDLPWSPLRDFWDFAGKTWMSHRGLVRERIPEFVQELAFRYNHRDIDLFPAVLEKIAVLQAPEKDP